TQLNGIEEAITQVHDNHLVAYLVSPSFNAESQAIAMSLNSYITNALKESLPLYMHPSVYIPISEIPLTANGKLDRKALPEPELVSSDEYVAPRNDTERQLCEVWQAVLGLEQV
ncbi:hypothetical protein, partial [uncultured Shewanella sp.]|uniref:hypothetical protein n=1 Tax=uncultured Shewanella sp. TaxID=173975 RepID=UPI00260D2222